MITRAAHALHELKNKFLQNQSRKQGEATCDKISHAIFREMTFIYKTDWPAISHELLETARSPQSVVVRA